MLSDFASLGHTQFLLITIAVIMESKLLDDCNTTLLCLCICSSDHKCYALFIPNCIPHARHECCTTLIFILNESLMASLSCPMTLPLITLLLCSQHKTPLYRWTVAPLQQTMALQLRKLALGI